MITGTVAQLVECRLCDWEVVSTVPAESYQSYKMVLVAVLLRAQHLTLSC